MTLSGLLGLLIVLLFFLLIIFFIILGKKEPGVFLRQIKAFNTISRSIGLAVEAGKRLHISLGRASINSAQAASALVGLSVLERIAHYATISDRPMFVTSGDGTLTVLSQATLRGAHHKFQWSEQFDPTYARLTGLTPFSYAAGTLPVIYTEQSYLNILLGHFGSEVLLIADASERSGGTTLAGSDSLPAQAVLYAAAEDPLVGEEIFAAGAYIQAGPGHVASLRAQDVLRWLIVLILIAGAALKLLGVI